jgi:O-methyltransferase
MIPKATYIKNLLMAHTVRQVEGCVVECGVWRGGMIAGLVSVLGSDREYFLFDSFEGLPPAKVVDGPAALAWQADVSAPGYHENCSASEEEAQAAMQRSGTKNYSLIKGWFEETVPTFKPAHPIALLRLDGDWYESTRICLQHLMPHLAPKGIVLIDDYYTWDGCARAVHEFLAQEGAEWRIQQFQNDVCVLSRK